MRHSTIHHYTLRLHRPNKEDARKTHTRTHAQCRHHVIKHRTDSDVRRCGHLSVFLQCVCVCHHLESNPVNIACALWIMCFPLSLSLSLLSALVSSFFSSHVPFKFLVCVHSSHPPDNCGHVHLINYWCGGLCQTSGNK